MKYLLLSIFLETASYVIPLEEKFNGSQTLYFVDGQLTDNPSENYITLRESVPWKEGHTQYKEITEGKVFITVNQSEKVELMEFREGHYRFPEGFNGQVGK